MSMNHWLIDSDQVIFVHRLRDTVTGRYLSHATLVATLHDSQGQPVVGAEVIAFVHQVGSNGNYVGNLPAAADLQPGQTYTLTLTASVDGFTRVWHITRTARHGGPTL